MTDKQMTLKRTNLLSNKKIEFVYKQKGKGWITKVSANVSVCTVVPQNREINSS